MSTTALMKTEALGWAMVVGAHDDGLTTFYNVGLGVSPGHIAFSGIGRVRVRFDSGASGLTPAIKSVLVRFRSTVPQLELSILECLTPDYSNSKLDTCTQYGGLSSSWTTFNVWI